MIWGVSHLTASCVCMYMCMILSGNIIFVLSYLRGIFHILRATDLLGLLSAYIKYNSRSWNYDVAFYFRAVISGIERKISRYRKIDCRI